MSESTSNVEQQILFGIIGGLIIGLSTSLYYVFNQKKIDPYQSLWSSLDCRLNITAYALAFLAGFLIIGGIFFDCFSYNNYKGMTPFGKKQQILKDINQYGCALAGLLMGLGIKILNADLFECAFYGFYKFNKRFMLALLIFLISACLTATLNKRKMIEILTDDQKNWKLQIDHIISANVSIGLGILFLIIALVIAKGDFLSWKTAFREVMPKFIFSLLAATGLLVSGLVQRANVIDGLAISDDWKPILIITLIVAILVSFIVTDHIIVRNNSIFFGEATLSTMSDKLDWKLFVGAILFGLGWGLVGISPSTLIIHLSIFTISIGLCYTLLFIFGMHIVQFVQTQS